MFRLSADMFRDNYGDEGNMSSLAAVCVGVRVLEAVTKRTINR